MDENDAIRLIRTATRPWVQRYVRDLSEPEKRAYRRGAEALEATSGPHALANYLDNPSCYRQAPHFDEQERGESDQAFIDRFVTARRLCATCPARKQCQDKLAALPEDQRAGIWAGVAYGKHPAELHEIEGATSDCHQATIIDFPYVG